MTIVLVKKSLRPAISRVETSERGIGLMGFVVSFRFWLFLYEPS